MPIMLRTISSALSDHKAAVLGAVGKVKKFTPKRQTSQTTKTTSYKGPQRPLVRLTFSAWQQFLQIGASMWQRGNALEKLIKQPPSWLGAALIPALGHPDSSVRQLAAWGLGKLRDRRAIPALFSALYDIDVRVGTNAANALAALRDPKVGQRLLGLLKKGPSRLRMLAASALGRMRHRPAVSALNSLVANPQWKVRGAAVIALYRIQGRRAIVHFMKLLNDKELKLTRIACQFLGILKARRAVPALMTLLKDRSVVIHAARALGQIGDARAAAVLRALWENDKSSYVRTVAYRAFVLLGQPKFKALGPGESYYFPKVKAPFAYTISQDMLPIKSPWSGRFDWNKDGFLHGSYERYLLWKQVGALYSKHRFLTKELKRKGDLDMARKLKSYQEKLKSFLPLYRYLPQVDFKRQTVRVYGKEVHVKSAVGPVSQETLFAIGEALYSAPPHLIIALLTKKNRPLTFEVKPLLGKKKSAIYYLLTGKIVIDSKSLRKTHIDQMLRTIKHEIGPILRKVMEG